MRWRYGQDADEGDYRTDFGSEEPDGGRPELSGSPIEPDSGSLGRKPVLRWILFIVFVLLTVLTAFHELILMRVGAYLVVSHELERSDLIVCLSGRAVERGLTAADVYGDGFAPKVFIAAEPPPDGYQAIIDHGIDVPESIDVLRRILTQMGVPEEAVVEGEMPAWSTMAEAMMVKSFIMEEGLASIILITSPTHTRRAWWTFRSVLENDGVEVRMHPASYSEFRAEDWWKTRRYAREVILEYQKLIFYIIVNYF